VTEPILGVVPNFSEGRRVDVMDAICDALQVPGAHLVYRQADADHNRLDTTVLGSRDGVRRAAVSAARVAAGLIDMEQHRGGHPRMGATDVTFYAYVNLVNTSSQPVKVRYYIDASKNLIEQLYPWPEAELSAAIAQHSNAKEIVWVQEEPANQGPLNYVMPRLRKLAGNRAVLSVKRTASASPATGSPKAHELEEKTLIDLAFGL